MNSEEEQLKISVYWERVRKQSQLPVLHIFLSVDPFAGPAISTPMQYHMHWEQSLIAKLSCLVAMER